MITHARVPCKSESSDSCLFINPSRLLVEAIVAVLEVATWDNEVLIVVNPTASCLSQLEGTASIGAINSKHKLIA